MSRTSRYLLACFMLAGAAALVLDPATLRAQRRGGGATVGESHGAFGALDWRSIGPLRGGRSIAVAGSAARPLEYYFGAAGGGLWKSTDGGTTWRPVTDNQITTSSVGAVAVAPSNPDVVYIGTGESEIRGNIAPGTASTSRPTPARPGRTSASRPPRTSRRSASTPPTPTSSSSRRSATTRRRTPSAASSDRRTAARRGRRCSTATPRRRASRSTSIRTTRTSCTPRCGRRSATPT